jgi:hypothetical protein
MYEGLTLSACQHFSTPPAAALSKRHGRRGLG